ncbi:B-cell receptor CD22-like [Clupea harengus]|uniref:B-cell receptor CD22-like n=1 Tax=Clupea harengus TaxID=7950 RepID=A0A8M1KGD1_CLUHA|nr:B-cell receptor CD22-like [Clupea harengus]
MHFCEGNTCLVAFLLSLPGVLDCWSVTYTPQSICAMRGSSVTMGCSYSYPNNATVTKPFWHKPGTLEDSSKQAEYKDRVKFVGNKENDCSMRMEGLRESDSGEYQFRIITNLSGGLYSGTPGVTLSVSTLQVEMSPTAVTEGQSVTLTCVSSCPAHANPTYIWITPVTSEPTISGNTLTLTSVSKKDEGRYSCALKGHEEHPSPSVCVLDCWSVTYTPQSICAMRGSSVTMGCSYSYPNRCNMSQQRQGNYSCALKGHEEHPSPSVTLIVRYAPRSVSVSLSPSGNIVEGDSVTLTCSSDANPPVHNYTWFKIRRWRNQITNISSEFSGHYHCEAKNDIGASNSSAVLVDVHYPPKNTSASISPSGNIVEGDSVTLTCSSDANPPVHNYTWYKKTGSDSIPIATLNNSSFPLVSGNGGLYYCVAHNEYGSHNPLKLKCLLQVCQEDCLQL